MKNKRPTWCHLLFYFTSYVLNMFRTLIYCASACNTVTTPTQPHRNSNTHRTKNNTTNVVIQQNSRKLLMKDILMSETCWAHKKWYKILSDIKLAFYYSTITMMQGPINISSDMFRCYSYTIIRERISLCLLKLRLLKQSIKIHCLLTKRYNLYKVLACSTTFFQLSQLCPTFFQLLMFTLFISSNTSSSQRVSGLPIDLLEMSSHLLTLWRLTATIMVVPQR